MRLRLCATARVFVVASLALACGDRSNGRSPEPATPGTAAPAAVSGSAPAPEQPPARATPSSPDRPAVELADAPSIDLLANRYRFHLYANGLVLAMASEGARKYTNEYRSPWGKVVEVGGRRGRVLGGRRAVLRFPWRGGTDGGVSMWLRAHGVASGQRVTVTVNGKRIATVAPAPDWALTPVAIPASAMRAGENEVRLEVRSRGRVAGARAYALIHSIELAPAGTAPPDAWPAASPVVQARTALALGGFRRLVLPVEVPPDAWLDVVAHAASAATFRVDARRVGGATTRVLEYTGAAGTAAPKRASLEALAGELVELELSIEGDGAWGAPRIALSAATVRPRPPPVDNVVLVVVDALRSDRLRVYGDTRVDTPRVTELTEARGVVYLHNQAASPSSPPSHGSIQTGMIPRVHGVAGDKTQLIAGTPMISTVLGAAGIATLYTGNNPFGMGRLKAPGKWTEYHEPNREGLGIDCEPLIGQILEFARNQAAAGKRFFVSSLPYETHVPYRYHAGITDKYYEGPWDKPIGKSMGGVMLGQITAGTLAMTEHRWNQLFALYDGEVERMDQCFGQLFDGLGELGLMESTAIVITSDHGEGMYEHNRMGHAFGHWFELGNVPFIVIAPGLVDSGSKVDVVTSHIDIAPTILDLMGVESEPRIQGASAVPMALRGGAWVPRVMSLEYGRSFALRSRGWRYIVDYTGGESLYDEVADPTEQMNVVSKSPIALRYFRDLTGFFLAHRSQWRVVDWGTLNDHSAGFVRDVGGEK